jgi:hypothetical protein
MTWGPRRSCSRRSGWDPANWETTRQRQFTINWLQLATTWAAFALFLVALIAR